jgi:hypothetical protein
MFRECSFYFGLICGFEHATFLSFFITYQQKMYFLHPVQQDDATVGFDVSDASRFHSSGPMPVGNNTIVF